MREQPFAFRLDMAVVTGAIDVLFSDGSLADYKTGQPQPQAQAVYEWQIRLYALALLRLRGQAPPLAHLCYIDSGAAYEVAVDGAWLESTRVRAEESIATLRPELRSVALE